jgi:hypothetical protein
MPLIEIAVALAASFVGASALAATGYGAVAGVAIPLAPVERPGLAVGFSAEIGADDPELQESASSLLRVRGELQGILTQDSKAILPTLSGDVGLGAGPLDLFLTGGVQIFGGTWRGDYAFFTTLGFTGGGGLALEVYGGLKLVLRGTVTWLPDFAAARVKGPEQGERPTLLFTSAMLGVVYTPVARSL